jgi:magnesium and cobalt exporter, CNNM family
MLEFEIIIRLLILSVLLFLSAFFSGSEVALFSLTPLARKKASNSKSRSSKNIVWLLRRPRRLIITLLVGNEIVNIIISILSAALSDIFFTDFSIWQRTLLSIIIIFPVLLIVGEITPKTIAFLDPEKWSKKVATLLFLFSKLITPLRLVFKVISDFVINILGGKTLPEEKPISELDFLMLVKKGYAEGNILDEEEDLIKNVFKFGDKVVKNVMTPMNKVYSIDINSPIESVKEKLRIGTYSRVPVTRTGSNEIVGILHLKDVLTLSDSNKNLSDLLKPPFYVSHQTKCLRLVDEFQKRRKLFAVVLDQNGRIVGIVTLEDLLEELVGEIYDEQDRYVSHQINIIGDSK